LQGRFSGRLATKDDEKRLNTECRLLGPLLGGVGKRGDGSRLTLAKIVRGIAAGDVRKFCEERERTIKVGGSMVGGRGPSDGVEGRTRCWLTASVALLFVCAAADETEGVLSQQRLCTQGSYLETCPTHSVQQQPHSRLTSCMLCWLLPTEPVLCCST